MSRRHNWIIAGLLLALFNSAAQAETRMIFPRVIFQKDKWTGIAIANPTSTDATVTLSAYNLDGTLFKQVTKSIAKGSQFVDLASATFAPPDALLQDTKPTRLWVEASSTVTGLTGFFLEANDSLDYMDGSDLSGYGIDLAIPIIEVGSGSVTEISVVNPDTSVANITVDFFTSDGSPISSNNRNRTVPIRGALQGPLSTYFPDVDFAQVTSLRLHSDRPVGCYGTIYRGTDNTLIVIAGQDASNPSKILNFPQLAEGDVWATALGVHNVSGSSVLVTISAYQSDGTLFAPPTIKNNPVSQEIKGGGLFRAKLNDLFGFPSAPLQTGWIKVEATTKAINGFVEYGAGSTRALVPAQTKTYQKAIFSYQVLGIGYFTGLAILNPGSLAANVEVSSLDKTGNPYGKTQMVLKPGQKESLLIQQWVPKAAGATSGSVFIKADNATVATQLFGTDLFSALANISPQEVTTDFDPGAGIPKITVTPPLAVVETGKPKTFASSVSGLDWLVEGIKGGGASFGSISATGVYQAPADLPSKHNITIQARTSEGDRSGGATIDVVRRETLIGGLTLLTAVAYLENLGKFYMAEQQLLSSAPSTAYQAVAQTLIEETLPTLVRNPFTTIPGDTIAKMIPFSDGGISYLLLAGFDSGKVYRLRMDTKALTTVATGLSQPNSLALDPITGDLLVSEAGANRITVLPRSQIAASPQTGKESEPLIDGPQGMPLALTVTSPQGIAFDLCTGTLYAILSDGSVHEFQGGRDRTVVSGLNGPRQIQVVYRIGLSCHDGLALAVTETNQITLIFPNTGIIMPLISDTTSALDLSFFPPANPFMRQGEASVIVGEGPPGNNASRVSHVLVGGIYTNVPPVQVPAASQSGTLVPYGDSQGDTFATSISTQQGLKVPDIRSVSSYAFAKQTPFGRLGIPWVSISLSFQDTISPPSANLPGSISGTIYLDSRSGGISVDILNRYNSTAQAAGFRVDYEIDLAKETITDMSSGQVRACVIQYWGNTLNILIPDSLFALENTKAIVLIGNRAELTDVAPNSGSIQLAP